MESNVVCVGTRVVLRYMLDPNQHFPVRACHLGGARWEKGSPVPAQLVDHSKQLFLMPLHRMVQRGKVRNLLP
jgi:hypothetical protein